MFSLGLMIGIFIGCLITVTFLFASFMDACKKYRLADERFYEASERCKEVNFLLEKCKFEYNTQNQKLDAYRSAFFSRKFEFSRN